MNAHPLLQSPGRWVLRERLVALLATPQSQPGLRFTPGPVPILALEGSPERRAALAGAFWKPVLPDLQRHILGELLREVEVPDPSRWLRWVDPRSPWQRAVLGAVARTAVPVRGSRLWPEIRSMARAAGASTSLAGLMLAAGDLDVWSNQFGCSTVAVRGDRSRSGRVLFGRNLDFDSFGVADVGGLLVVHHPERGSGEIPSASLGWVGLWGSFTGWNREGLHLGSMVVYNARPEHRAAIRPWRRQVPAGRAFDEVLRSCRDVVQAIDWFRRNGPIGPCQVLLADRGGAARLVEWAPGGLRVRDMDEDVLFGTNYFRGRTSDGALALGEEGSRCEDGDGREATLTWCFRDRRRLDVDGIQRLLGQVHQDELTLHSVVFEPQDGRVHLALGHLPATSGPWHSMPSDVWASQAVDGRLQP